jgi:hypothetical protein
MRQAQAVDLWRDILQKLKAAGFNGVRFTLCICHVDHYIADPTRQGIVLRSLGRYQPEPRPSRMGGLQEL